MSKNPKQPRWYDMIREPLFNVIIREEDINVLEDDICLEGNEDYSHKRGAIIGTYSIRLSTAKALINTFNTVVNLHNIDPHIYHVKAESFGYFTFIRDDDTGNVYRTFCETLIIPEKQISDTKYEGTVWYQFVPKDYQGLVMEFEIPVYDIIKWVEYFE